MQKASQKHQLSTRERKIEVGELVMVLRGRERGGSFKELRKIVL